MTTNLDKDYYARLDMIKSQRGEDLDIAWLLAKLETYTNAAKWDLCPDCASRIAIEQNASYDPNVLMDGWYS